MVNPYDIILMPWITEKTLEARRVADLDNNYLSLIHISEPTRPY